MEFLQKNKRGRILDRVPGWFPRAYRLRLAVLNLIGLGLASLNLGSCSALWPVMAIPVTLPAFPEAWSSADAWELDWRSMETFGETRFAEPGETLVLFLPRNSSAAVRCKPVFRAARGLPYGAIWPLDTDPAGALILSSWGGLSAELAFRLYQGGWEAGNFNFGRFGLEVEQRMTDPWESDMPALAKAVAEERFRADYLRNPARTQLEVFGVVGSMAPESPWGKVLEPDTQGQVVLAVSAGIHRWFGASQELVVSVSPEGSSEWILRGVAGRVMEKVLP